MKPKIRCAVTPLNRGERELDHDASRYLLKVHRLRQGDTFTAFDPVSRTEAEATLVSTERKLTVCSVGEPRPARLVSTLPVTLLQAVGKGDKPEQVIRDATQLGAQHVILVLSERSVVQGSRHTQRMSRYERVALESARQCGRGDLPTLSGPWDLDTALTAVADRDLRLLFDAAASKPLATAFNDARVGSIAVLIGPEGGLSEPEQACAIESGFTQVRLGPFVLRTETAAIAALAALAQHCQLGESAASS